MSSGDLVKNSSGFLIIQVGIYFLGITPPNPSRETFYKKFKNREELRVRNEGKEKMKKSGKGRKREIVHKLPK